MLKDDVTEWMNDDGFTISINKSFLDTEKNISSLVTILIGLRVLQKN